VWTVSRTEQANHGKNKNCFLNGTVVAYYVELKNNYGWPPQVEILNTPENEEKYLRKGEIGLIELRWFDPIGEKRHRWYNHRLASFLQWTGGIVIAQSTCPGSLIHWISFLQSSRR